MAQNRVVQHTDMPRFQGKSKMFPNFVSQNRAKNKAYKLIFELVLVITAIAVYF